MKHSRARSGFVVAIDGPAGSGKSTTARLCAGRLGFHYLDTGAMYRAVTLKALETGANPCRPRQLARLLSRIRVEPDWRGSRLRVELDGQDVTERIREPRVSAFVSEVSAISAVRRKLVQEQRRIARGRKLVCEGRDIGSVVFPDARLKVFIVCDAAERARRRQVELAEQGTAVDREAVLANLTKRDRIDSGRRVSPLKRVSDAVLVDTTHLTVDEQVAVVCALARERLRAGTGK